MDLISSVLCCIRKYKFIKEEFEKVVIISRPSLLCKVSIVIIIAHILTNIWGGGGVCAREDGYLVIKLSGPAL